MNIALSPSWAKEIPKEVLLKVIEVGGGHSILPSYYLVELGLAKNIVQKISQTHKSENCLDLFLCYGTYGVVGVYHISFLSN